MTHQQINYMYIQKEGHTNQNNFKGFYNEHLLFNFSFCCHKFNNFWHIQSFPIIRFNICFFLNSWYKGHSNKKKEIHLPNNLNRFYIFFHY